MYFSSQTQRHRAQFHLLQYVCFYIFIFGTSPASRRQIYSFFLIFLVCLLFLYSCRETHSFSYWNINKHSRGIRNWIKTTSVTWFPWREVMGLRLSPVADQNTKFISPRTRRAVRDGWVAAPRDPPTRGEWKRCWVSWFPPYLVAVPGIPVFRWVLPVLRRSRGSHRHLIELSQRL